MGRLTEVSEFEDIIIKAQPPATEASQTLKTTETGQTTMVVRIKDVARVELSQEAFTTFSGLSGKKAAQINLHLARCQCSYSSAGGAG